MKVLFVCTQNVFRSFSAKLLLEKYLLQKKNTTIIVDSAGTEAFPDRPYSYTLEELTKLGISNLDHQQKRITKELLEAQDMIICMTKRHQKEVFRIAQKKSYLFNELAFGKKTDLEDDVETGQTAYGLEEFVRGTVQKIASAIPFLYQKITTIL